MCDFLNLASTTSADQSAVLRVMKVKLRNTELPSVVFHSLTLVETCVKNCGVKFARTICNQQFMRLLEDLAVSQKGSASGCKWLSTNVSEEFLIESFAW